jgi:threonine dehydrogenase-like Zn-dependent dehydrogenase
MRAVVLEQPGKLAVRDIPRFALHASDEVLVRVAACGICGSDLRYYAGENPWAVHTLGRHIPSPPNVVLGHEFSGTVVAVNDPANERLIGSRVGVVAFKGCGECSFCRGGRENLCGDVTHIGHAQGWGERPFYPGAYAEFVPAWASLVFALPDSVSFEQAAMLDILAVSVHVARRAQVSKGSTLLCIGAGPGGNAVMQTARVLGASTVVAVERSPLALRVARECGFDNVLDARSENVLEAMMDLTEGRGADAVCDSVGSTETLELGLACLAPAGTLVNMALHAGNIGFAASLLAAERSICTAANNTVADFLQAFEHLRAGRYMLGPWFTHRFPLEGVHDAFDLLMHGDKQAFKVLLLPSLSAPASAPAGDDCST